MQTMLQIRATYGRRAFGTQCQQVAASVFESVHLLLDDVGNFTNSPYEQSRVLKYRSVNSLVPKTGGYISSV